MDGDKTQYYWKAFVSLLDFVDLIREQPELKAKLKTRILDLGHEVKKEIESSENKEEK